MHAGNPDILKNAEKCGNGHTVIRHGHLLTAAGDHAAHDVGAVEHAGPAVDDKVIGRKVLRKIAARCHIYRKALT